MTAEAAGSPATGPDAGHPGTRWIAVVVAGAVGALLVSIVVVVSVLAATSGSTTRSYTIEAGTGARLDAGEVVEIMPTEVRLEVGDTLVLRNEDDRDVRVGPYLVRAGEVVEQTFERPQTLVGDCSLSGTGEIRIVVI